MWFGVAPGMGTKKTYVQERLDNVLKCEHN